MFTVHSPQVSILAEESGHAVTIHSRVTLLHLNENEKAHGFLLHQYGIHLEVDLIKQEQLRCKTRTSGFQTDGSTIEPSHLLQIHSSLVYISFNEI